MASQDEQVTSNDVITADDVVTSDDVEYVVRRMAHSLQSIHQDLLDEFELLDVDDAESKRRCEEILNRNLAIYAQANSAAKAAEARATATLDELKPLAAS